MLFGDLNMDDIRTKCGNELRSFFGLTVFNIVIAALTLALGISLGVTQLLNLIQAGEFQVTPFIGIVPGLLAVGAGFFWLIKTAEILDGVDDINTEFEAIKKVDDSEKITGVLVKMMAHYRKNRPILRTMNLFGRIGGSIFLVVGIASVVYALFMLVTMGMSVAFLGQFAGGLVAVGVGVGSLLIARFFQRYSGVWDTRLQHEDSISETLNKQLGTS